MGMSYWLDTEGKAVVEVYSMSWERVRVLEDPSRSVGAHALAWDGKDERGRTVSTGLYLLVLTKPGGFEAAKVLVIRR